jgi:putative iron-only hydrogenase system regulator
METRIALIGIIVENKDSIVKVNSILHEYGDYIVGRMGIPYPKRQISVISIIVDAPTGVISALSGKLGMLPSINIKTVYSKAPSTKPENEDGSNLVNFD